MLEQNPILSYNVLLTSSVDQKGGCRDWRFHGQSSWREFRKHVQTAIAAGNTGFQKNQEYLIEPVTKFDTVSRISAGVKGTEERRKHSNRKL